MTTAQEWHELLPSPYDISMSGWSRVHWVELHVQDIASQLMISTFRDIWKDMEASGKKAFLERNGILPENTRSAAVHFSLHNKVRLCIMAPLPEDVRVLFHLTFNEPDWKWRL